MLNWLCLYEFRWNNCLLWSEWIFVRGSIPVQTACQIWCWCHSCLSQGFTGSFHLGRGRAKDRLLTYSVVITTLSGSGSDHRCWNRSSEGSFWADTFPFMCVFLLFLHWILAQEMEGVLKKQRGFMWQNFIVLSCYSSLCLSWSIYLQLLFLLPCSESASQSKQRPCGLSPYIGVWAMVEQQPSEV